MKTVDQHEPEIRFLKGCALQVVGSGSNARGPIVALRLPSFHKWHHATEGSRGAPALRLLRKDIRNRGAAW